MTIRASRAMFGVVALTGCSDTTAPAPGTFEGQLSGARVAVLEGPSNAGPIFLGQFPDARFAIRMLVPRGDAVRAIVLHCPGGSPPVPGSYAVSPVAADCVGSYSRVVSTLQGGTTALEETSASSGRLTISTSSGSQTVGTFNFEGILVVGSDSVGKVVASGEFSADMGS